MAYAGLCTIGEKLFTIGGGGQFYQIMGHVR